MMEDNKMKLNLDSYRDKVYACWLGKNIGGTMGTPYEGIRSMHDIHGFATEANVILPNDDLDLQLMWLAAVENCGIAGLDAKRLGEMWLSYITPHWNEYGIGKANMQLGIQPPLSGDAFNPWNHSNGAWIRTEIWACLAPGAPDIAMKYAYEDACVDHGTGEGTVAAMLVSALESAAFVEQDIMQLIDIGLSKIPADSRLAASVRLLLECFKSGMDYRDARDAIFKQNADIGDGWFEAPSNVTYALLGLLWGDGDFKKSMIYAINCGDDTDCTAATVGSILGILGGTEAIPEDWRRHIGDGIVTATLAECRMHMKRPPKTCRELTERVVQQAPGVLAHHRADVAFTSGADEIPADITERIIADDKFSKELSARPPYSFRVDFEYAAAIISLEGDPRISPGGHFAVHAHFINLYRTFGNPPYLLKFRWLLPDGFTVSGPRSVILPEMNAHCNGVADVDFVINAPDSIDAVNRIVLEAMADGRMSAGYMPITLLG